MNNDRIRRVLWSVFSRIGTEYRDLDYKSLYSVRMQKNMDQKNSEFGTFLRSLTCNSEGK